MQTNSVNHQRLNAVLVRWEQAVYNNASGDFDDVEAMDKEVTESREAVLDVLRDAKVVVENPDSERWEYVVGKALKDWATALMARKNITRADARSEILDFVRAKTNVEASQAPPAFNTKGCESGRIQSSEPNFIEVERALPLSGDLSDVYGVINQVKLDHLPEGSH